MLLVWLRKPIPLGLILVLLLPLLWATGLSAQERPIHSEQPRQVQTAAVVEDDVAALLKLVDEATAIPALAAEVRQVFLTPQGYCRTQVFRIQARDNGNRVLVVYTEPEELRDSKLLLTDFGANVWRYDPVHGRVTRAQVHGRRERLAGSDLAFQDLELLGPLSGRFKGVIAGEDREGGVVCLRLELTPLTARLPYGRIVAWVGKRDNLPRRFDFYRRGAAEPDRRVTLEDYRVVQGQRFAHVLTVATLADRSQTVLLFNHVQLHPIIPEMVFDPRNLNP